jgi:hypothetical protein
MAFYFGKENFRAATESVSQIAKQLTSQEKLGQTRAQEIGKAIDDVAPLRLGPGDSLATITLETRGKNESEGSAIRASPYLGCQWDAPDGRSP